MVFNPDFTLQLARDHQAELARCRRHRLEPAAAAALRQRIGAWIVRLGRAVEGPALVRPSRAW